MGNDNAGTVFHDLLHGILNILFRSGVNIGGSLIQDQDLRIGNQSSGNGQQLFFTLTDICSGI